MRGVALPDAAVRAPTTACLLQALETRGIDYLIGSSVASSASSPGSQWRILSDTDLLAALSESQEPRIADALIGLLLLHPHLAASLPNVSSLVPLSAPDGARMEALEARERWLTRVLATLYLQRMWTSLLTLALSSTHFWLAEAPFQAAWRARQLPPPWFGDGQPGLAALGAWQRQATGLPARFEEDWLNQAQHLIRTQLRRRLSRSDPPNAAVTCDQVACQTSAVPTAQVADAPCVAASLAAIPQAPSMFRSPRSFRSFRSFRSSTAAGHPWPDGAREPRAPDMRVRQPVERSTIEAFWQELGRRVRHPGKLYLTGGAALVHAGLRGEGAATPAIDLKLDAANEAEVQDALRQLQDQLHIDLKLAWPGDFLPVPPSWEAGSPYIGRYGALEVFYVDFAFLALAKVARGSERDLGDLEALARSGVVSQKALEAAAEAIRPQLGRGRFFNVDPQRFAVQLAMVTQRVWGRR